MKFIPKRLNLTRDVSRGRFKIQDWAKGLAAIALVLIAAYFVLGAIADGIANSISAETEAELFAWLDLGETPIHDPQFDRAQEIFARLSSDPELRPLPYQLVLYPMDAANAFAVPGGMVGVTPPLLEEVDSEIGLAFVLAHELGHHQHRHALKRLGRGLIYSVTMSWFGGDGSALLDSSLSLATLKHSRDQEREADEFGLNLVYRTYGTTDGAYEFFEDMAKLHGDGTPLGAMFQTHPLTEERIDNLRKAAEELHVH